MSKELIKEYADIDYPTDKSMNEWVQKKYLADAVRLSSGAICGIEKPNIETRFCFSDEGPEYDYYHELCSDDNKMKEYFFHENLAKLDEQISIFKGEDDRKEPAISGGDETRICRPSFNWKWEENEYVRPITDEDTKIILKALEGVREAFVKRLNTWWKRYGVEKLHTWTYWANA